MIDLVDLVPTMEHAMQGSVTFAALAHGGDVFWKRLINWLTERRWAKQDAAYAALAQATPASIVTSLEGKVEAIVDEVKETVKSKVKKNG